MVPPQRATNSPKSYSKVDGQELKGIQWLTVCRQVVHQRGQEGDEPTGNDHVDDVEQRLAFDDEVEGDVLVFVAVHRDALVDVSSGRSVNDLPFTIFWGIKKKNEWLIQKKTKKPMKCDSCLPVKLSGSMMIHSTRWLLLVLESSSSFKFKLISLAL